MNKMPKIGIMTYYAVQNYGAALQAFALQQNIERLGAKAEFLRYFDKHNESTGSKRNSLFSLLFHNRQLQSNLLHFARFIRVKRFCKPNIIAFNAFREKYLHCSVEPYYDFEDLKQSNSRYDGFIAGSDMVWTPIGQNLEAYFLQFADKSKRFSYAPSMTGCNTFSIDDTTKIKSYIEEINTLSCREQEGVDYIKNLTGRDAALTIDPTLLFSKEKWKEHLGITSQRPAKPYILCYNFGGLPKKIENEIHRIAKERNMDIRYIPLCHKESDAELKIGHHGPCGPREFVELFLNASFCVTNTFHGFLFSIISENPFVVIHREKGNAWKANETRISNLMDMLGLVDRYIDMNSRISNKYLSLDYTQINEYIKVKRSESLNYLKRIISKSRISLPSDGHPQKCNVLNISGKQCTGCGLCSTVCHFDAITMKEDDEGFIKPEIDEDRCKECGKCARLCPSLHPINRRIPAETRLCLSKDKCVKDSASGGLFITIAKYFIEHLHGFVYGAVFDKNFNCIHEEASTIEQLRPMQNSKYVQSQIGDCYAKAKQRLTDGHYVLFTGTPCQIAALISYLGKEYERLLTIDVVCHGVPNQRYWHIYLNEFKHQGLKAYRFRNRANKCTWNPTSRVPRRGTLEATIVASWGEKHIEAQQDAFYGPFVRCESYRISCYYCQYARKERVSDITMGDCDSDNQYPDFYPYVSKSIALINTIKGQRIWNDVSDSFESTELCYSNEIAVNTCLHHPSIMPEARKSIYMDLKNLFWKDFKRKYIRKHSKLALFRYLIKHFTKK